MKITQIKNRYAHEKLFMIILCVYFVVMAMLYALYITPRTAGISPDGEGHISYAQYLASEHRLPTIDVTRMSNAVQLRENMIVEPEIYDGGRNWIAQHPPLYYIIMAVVYGLGKFITLQFSSLLVYMRMANVVLGVLTIVALYKCCKESDLGKSATWCIVAMFALSPHIQFFFSQVENDNLLVLESVLITLSLLKYLHTKQKRWFFSFVILAVLTMYTKYTGAILIVPYSLYLVYRSFREDEIKKTLGLCAVAVIMGVILFGPFLAYNYKTYDGRIFPLATGFDYAGEIPFKYSVSDFLNSEYFEDITTHISILVGGGTISGLKGLSMRSMGRTFDLLLNSAALLVICVPVLFSLTMVRKRNKFLILLGGLGLFLFLVIRLGFRLWVSGALTVCYIQMLVVIFDTPSYEKRMRLFFLGSCIVFAAIFMYQHYGAYLDRGMPGATQGRYYFPLYFPFLYVFFSPLERFREKHPEIAKFAPLVIITLMLIFDIGASIRLAEIWNGWGDMG